MCVKTFLTPRCLPFVQQKCFNTTATSYNELVFQICQAQHKSLKHYQLLLSSTYSTSTKQKMSLSASPRDKQLAGNWLETKWLASTKTSFSELSNIALKWPPVSRTFYLAGVDPENLYQVTYGSNRELHDTLHAIYVEHGAVDLQVRGCDEDGKYYLKCSQPGRKRGPAKAVICVSLTKVEKGRTHVAKNELPQPEGDEKAQDQGDWEDVMRDEAEEEDDWVKV